MYFHASPTDVMYRVTDRGEDQRDDGHQREIAT